MMMMIMMMMIMMRRSKMKEENGDGGDDGDGNDDDGEDGDDDGDSDDYFSCKDLLTIGNLQGGPTQFTAIMVSWGRATPGIYSRTPLFWGPTGHEKEVRNSRISK